MEQFDTLPIQYRHIEHMHDGVWLRKNCFDKITAVRTSTIIPWALIIWLLILCLYNVDILNICMKEFGSQKIIFDKMTAVRT